MTYQEFFDQLPEEYKFNIQKRKKVPATEISKKWMTGGVGGGSCWAESSQRHYAVEGEEEPDFYALDEILNKFAPNISYLHYKQLTKLIHYEDHTEYEYYGNSTTHRVKKMALKDLYSELYNLGYVCND